MPRARVRLDLLREGDEGWTLADRHYGSCVTFDTRAEGRAAHKLAREYLKLHGNINLMSFPYNLEQPFGFPVSDDPRFVGDVRIDTGRGHRNPAKPDFEDEVVAWFEDHPDEHAEYLSYPAEGEV